MADQEVSKVMWIAIVVALAASVFTIAKPQINTLAEGVFDKVEEVVSGKNTGDDNNNSDKPDNKGDKLVGPGDVNVKTSAPGAEDGRFEASTTLKDNKENDVAVTYVIKDSSDGDAENGKLKAGTYTVTYSAEGYADAKQTVTVIDPEPAPELVAPAALSLETPGFKQTIDAKIPGTLKNTKGEDVAVDVKLEGGTGATDTKALTRGTYQITYLAEGYEPVKQTVTVADKMVTPSKVVKTMEGGGKNPSQAFSGKTAPNAKVEIQLGLPNGDGGKVDWTTVETTADASGNFKYVGSQFEFAGSVQKAKARTIYEYSKTDKLTSAWTAESSF